MNNLVPENEKDRLKAIKEYNILNTPREREFDRLTEIASIIFQVPYSIIAIISEDKQWMKSMIGPLEESYDRRETICQTTILKDETLEVYDALLDERFKNLPSIKDGNGVRFYAGHPIIDSNGYALGTMCIMDNTPRKLNEVQLQTLKLLAEEASALILERRQKEEFRYFEKIFKSSDDLICVADTNGYFKRVNPAFTLKLGWEEDFLIKENFFNLIHPDDIQSTSEILRQLNEGKSIINFTNRFITKDNKHVYIQWFATPEKENGNVFAIGRDVTENKLNEKSLKESQKKLSLFFENSQGLMCTHDMKGNFITINTAGAELLGYKVEELLGKNLSSIMPKKHHAELEVYIENLRTNGKAQGIIVTQHKDGSKRIWMYNNVVENTDPNNVYVIGNSIDITERFKLEQDLYRTKTFLEQTNLLADVGGWEIDLIKNKIYWSDITKRIHGVSLDFEPDMDTALSFFEGDDREVMERAVSEGMKTGKKWDIESLIRRKDGEKVWVRAIGQAEFRDGECVKLFGALQDINKRKLAELEIIKTQKLLNNILDSTYQVSIISVDINGIITSINKGTENILGYKEDELAGKSDPSIIHSKQEIIEYSKFLSEKYNTKIEGFRTFVHQAEINGSDQREWTYIKKDGTEIKVSLVITPIRDVDSNIIGYLGVAIDVTEAYTHQIELLKAKTLAEEANKAKSEFLANMSHEIRTPLNGIIGFTELVLKSNLTDIQSQYLQIVNQSASTLLSIINDILDFSKIEAGKLELDIDRTDLYELSSQAADIISFQAQSKNIEMLLNIDPSLPRFMFTDNIRLKQIVVNLLGNAVKFTEKGEIELNIYPLEKINNEQYKVRFEVKDTGIGIHPDKQEKIFEAFSQEDSSTTKKYGGTGLGLSISNKLLKLMGSRLYLESAIGEGSKFYFDIILKFEEGELLKYNNIEQIKNVLIVDDHQRNREILKQMLLLRNIKSTEAKNGIDAIHLLSNGHKFDLVIMDFNMPYMDGIETIKKIRENLYPDSTKLPIILFHSSADDQAVSKAADIFKINKRITKPIKIDELYNCISNLYVKENTDEKEHDQSSQILSSKTILIAEDNQVNMLLSKILIGKILPNAKIIEAFSGKDAIEYCKNNYVDLIYMDIQMPDLNGYEATQILRNEYNLEIPILALTAGTVKGEAEKCLSAGMNDFINKPISEKTIYESLKKWLNIDSNENTNSELEVDSKMVFDMSILKSYFGDDSEMITEVLRSTELTLNESLERLMEINDKDDLESLKYINHKLIGMSKATGLLSLHAKIETNLENTEDKYLLNTYLDELITEVKIAIDKISENYKI